MDRNSMIKQMLDLQKAAFDGFMGSMATVQDQARKLTEMMLDQSGHIPENGKKIVDEWFKTCQKGREQWRAAMEENFKKAESYFSEKPKAEPSRPPQAQEKKAA